MHMSVCRKMFTFFFFYQHNILIVAVTERGNTVKLRLRVGNVLTLSEDYKLDAPICEIKFLCFNNSYLERKAVDQINSTFRNVQTLRAGLVIPKVLEDNK